MPAMQKVFSETGKEGIVYVFASGFGVAMVSNQAKNYTFMMLLMQRLKLSVTFREMVTLGVSDKA